MTLTIEKRRLEPDMIVLAVSGKLTLGRESQQVERLVEEIIRDNERKVILDLSGLELIDSTGVGIVAVQRQAAAGGRRAARGRSARHGAGGLQGGSDGVDHGCVRDSSRRRGELYARADTGQLSSHHERMGPDSHYALVH